MRSRSFFVVFALLSSGLLAAPAAGAVRAATVWEYPGPAPCDTTLQNCYNATGAGDTIRIVDSVASPGSVNISRSITIEGDPALSPAPRLGKASVTTSINISSEDPTDVLQVNVTIRDLRLRQAKINAYYPKGSGSVLEVTGLRMWNDFDGAGDDAIGLTAYAPITLTVSDNVIDSDSSPVGITAITGGTAGFGSATPGTFEAWIERNVMTTPDPADSYGLDIDMRPLAGSAAHVRVYDNLISGHAGCNCGGAASLQVRSVNIGQPPGLSVADIWHNTIVRTARGGNGPGSGIDLYRSPHSKLQVNMYDNIAALGQGPGVEIGPSDRPPSVSAGRNVTWGNTEPNEWSGVDHSDHLSVDPRFVDVDARDFRLRADSPLIDEGVVCAPGGLGVLDVTGAGRMAGTSVDIGAYERGSSSQPEGVAIMGTAGADLLTGTAGQDFLCGFGDVDELRGLAGNDYLNGGKAPDDMVYGGGGEDVLVTKDGWAGDLADGAKGSDVCRTDPGDIRVSC